VTAVPDVNVPTAVAAAAGTFGNVPSAPTFRQQFLVLVRESWLLKFALAWISLVIFLAIFGYAVAPFDPTRATANTDAPPSGEHWFGTDSSGMDVFSRVITAPRIDVSIAIGATLLALTCGAIIGIAASYSRGWGASLIMRASDTMQAAPAFIVILIFVVMVGPSYLNIILILAIVEVPLYVRLIRSEVLSLRERAFVETARASGNSPVRIAFRHVLPNSMAPALAQASITFGVAILLIAGLSFVGAGVQPPTPEWGQMIADGTSGILLGRWWEVVFAGLAMVGTVFSFAVLGEALQTIALRRR
jgi:peptide/nickel transport system permease protein